MCGEIWRGTDSEKVMETKSVVEHKRGIWTDEERDKGGDSGETGTEEDNAGVKNRKMRKKGREYTGSEET